MTKERDKKDNYARNCVNYGALSTVEEGKNLTPAEGKETISYLRLFQYATTLDKICMLLGIIFSIASGLLQPFLMLKFGDVTGALVAYGARYNASLPEEEQKILANTLEKNVTSYCVEWTLYGFGILAMTYLSIVLFNYSAIRQIFKMRKSFLEKTLNQDIAWFDTNQTGDFATTFTQNISKIEEGIGDKIVTFLFFQSIFIGGIVMALVKGWKLALVCMVSLPLAIGITTIITKVVAKFSEKEMDAYGRAGAIAEEVLSSIKTVVAFDGQMKEMARYNKNLIYAKNNNIKRGFFNALSNGILWFCIYGCYALTFWYGIKLILEDKYLPFEEQVYTPGNMVAVFFCALTATFNFGLGVSLLESFASAKAAAQKIFSVLDSEPVINKNTSSGTTLESFSRHITFDNVFFNYPSRPDVKVLQGFSLQINKGETIALVGSSGCGKSTCVQLLQRFYDPIQGEITIDNIDLKEMKLKWLREKIAVVSQEPSLFGITIYENIRYGKLSATKEEIESAAKKANVDSFIKKLPKGYETVLGERGAQLSGGQKQRIAIARALVRNPDILLLDEATSALDTTSEAEVQAALDSISGICTTIIVAHRLSTIRTANRIVVLNEGKVLEIGTHAELMEKKEVYWNLVNSQGLTDTDNQKEDTTVPRVERMGSIVSPLEVAEEENIIEQKPLKGVLWKVLKLNSKEWYLIIIGCISALLTGLALPFYGIAFGGIIGVLSSGDDDKVRHQGNIYCLIFLIIGIVYGTCMFTQMFTFCISGEKLTLKIRSKTFAAILRQEMGWFDRKDNRVGALCSRLAGDAVAVQGAAGIQIGTTLNFISTFICTCGTAFYYEWRISLVLLSLCPVCFFVIFAEQKIMRQDASKNQNMLEKSSNLAVEAIGSIRTVVSLGCEQTFLNEYIKELLPYESVARKKSHFRGLVFGCTRSLLLFAYVAGIKYGTDLIIAKEVDYQTVFTVIQVMVVGTWTTGNAMAMSPNFQKSFVAASRIISLLERIPLIGNLANPIRTLWEDETVEYSEVYFSYPTRPSVSVLNGLDLKVVKGKTVALVGSSGCGKSTIVQLLQRFYDPLSGKISVNGDDIKDMDIASLRSQLGVVSQEPNLFDMSIADNIAYGANFKTVDMNTIIEAAKSANIHNFIITLPMGYDTRIGSKGTQLSGGQKQRIAIARALVRNPKILLLDEATSALDNESEKIVQEALDNASKNRTCITIAHRLTTVQDADVICVLKKGVVVEIGTHKELLEKRGLYYEFYVLQSVE